MSDGPYRSSNRALRRTLAATTALTMALLLPPVPAGAGPTIAASAAPTNLALHGTATASSVELDRDEFAAAHVNDGDRGTRWSSKYQDDNWVRIELAEPSTVDHVVLHWPNACARDFVLQTSTDGETWTDVRSLRRDTCPRTDVVEVRSTEPVSHVRMQGRTRWASWGYSLSEFEIWDAPKAAPEGVRGLLPEPVHATEHDAAPYTLRRGAHILAVGDGATAPATALAKVLRPSTGFALPVTPASAESVPDRARGRSAAPIVVDVRPGNAPRGHEDEGYTLTAGADGVRIAAETPAGALNGVQTLRQLFPQWVESDHLVVAQWTVPAVSVVDYPRFAHRGMMLDVARSFYPVEEVKEYIDSAAQFKINRLHLHLTDDQGWRIAIDQPEETDNPSGIDYGLLTEVGGTTAMTERGTEPGITGYYTQDDYREIVRYAAENGMTVIPEIDMPGHVNSALHSIPQLNTPGARPQPPEGSDTVPHNGTGAVGYSSLDAHSPATYEFVEHVLTEIAELTPGPYLHIGGDEAHVTSHDDYLTMVNAFSATVGELGKTVVGWNEYAGSELPRNNAVVQYWWGDRNAVAEAVNGRGAQVVLSPAQHTYLPQKQDPRQPEGGTWACGGVCGLDRHYNWNPGTFVPGIEESDVLGVESALWGEFIRRVDQAQYYTYPRLIALAEVGWTPQAQRDYTDFTARLSGIGGRLTVQGTNFFPSADVAWGPSVLGTSTPVGRGEPAGAEWTITAPGYRGDDLDATLVWSDGVEERLLPVTEREGDIPAMRVNGTFTAVSARVLDRPGEYTATLSVSAPGRPTVENTVTVVVR